MKELLRQIRDNNILLEVVDGKLQVFAGDSEIHPGLLSAIKEQKAELLQFLADNDQAGFEKGYTTNIPLVPVQENYPLSSAQYRLWLANQLPGASVAYHMVKSYVLEGNVNEESFVIAFDQLIARHESLRTIFRENEEGAIRQWILPLKQTGFQLSCHDLRYDAQREEVLKREVQEQWTTPFDLATGPLIRGSLFRTDNTTWVFSYVMHHLVSDGWSMEVMLKELMQLYSACCSGQQPSLAPLRIQYKDYTAWQQSQLTGAAFDRHRSYWLEQFSGELPVLDLPIDNPRAAVRNYKGSVVRTAFNDELVKGLKGLVTDQGVSFFMGLLSGVYTFLYRYTGQDDIIVGSPIAGREHVDLEDQIGLYVNTLALRNRFSGSDTFKALLNKVSRVLLDAYEHQAYPFDELVVELNAATDRSRNALFDVMVVFQPGGINKAADDRENIRVTRYEGVENQTSKFDLSFVFIESEEQLFLETEYNSNLFNQSTIVQFVTHLQQLITAAIEHPATPVMQLEYLTNEERRQLLERFNNTTVDFSADTTLIKLFEEQVNKTPDKIAVVFETTTLTYRELNDRCNRLGNFLRVNYHIQPNDLVGIKLNRSEWLMVAILGVLKAGGAYVPIDPSYPRERVDFLVTDSRCKVVIDEEELALFTATQNDYSGDNGEGINKPTDLAYVLYTSGSTGQPKGCMLAHRGVINRIEWMWNQFGFETSDVILQKTTFTFDVSVWEIFMPLCLGAQMVVCPQDDNRYPERILSLIEKYQITCLHFVPGLLQAFINSLFDRSDIHSSLQSLRQVITSGEALLPQTVKAWYEKTATPIYNLYGPTEASIDVTYYVTAATDTVIPIGRPIWNTQMYITDSAGRLLPVGVAGEICIGGVGLAKGYLNRPELTSEKFVNNPFINAAKIYRTGDLGRWLPDGNIEFIGRVDNQVKIRGYRIELAEIESVLQKHPAVDGAVVITRSSVEGGKELIAYIVLREDLDGDELRSYLMSVLPAYMVPAYFVRLADLPLTFSGKVNRKKLPDPDGLAIAARTEYVAPRNDMEEKVAALVEAVTGRKRPGMKDNFFALGGDSIKIITFTVAVRKQLQVQVSVKNLYETGILEDWAAYISAEKNNHNKNGVYSDWAIGLEEIARIRLAVEEEDQLKNRLPAVYDDLYPLVQIEQGMIYSSLLNPVDPVYYDQYSFIIRLKDPEQFKDRLQQLVNRHSILRTKYYINSFSHPVKVVVPEIDLPFTFNDLSGLPDSEQKNRLKEYIGEDLNIRLTFDGELLWRVNLFRLADDTYFITYSVHHALLDGWSMAVFKTEIMNADSGTLPLLPYSYKDYCAICLGRKRVKGIEDYWKNLLQGYTRNKLPFNYKGVRISEAGGMRKVNTTIDEQLLKDLTRLAAYYQLSFKAICVAAHICLLHIVCAEDDIVTGIVTHERPEIEGGESMLGCFLTTIPIRVRFDQQVDVLSLLQQVNNYLSGVKPYEIHLSEIAAMIGEKTSFGNPVFDTLLNYTDFHTFSKISGNDFINILEAGSHDPELELSNEMTNTLFDVEVSKTLDRFTARIKYAPGYFNEEDVRYALNIYVRILETFAKDIHTPLASLNILTAQERQEILVNFNATQAPYAVELTLDKLFEIQVAKTPDAIALRQDGISFSYKVLNERANQLAACLLANGVKAGDNIGLYVSRSFDMIIGMYGILKTGAAYVPIDPEYPADRQEYIARNSGVTIIVIDAASLAGNKVEGMQLVRIDEIALSTFSKENPGIIHDSYELAYTIYTSGSTGKPKGVMIEHHSAVNLVEWVNDTFRISANDRLLFITSMCFDLSVYDVFGMLAAGGTVVIARNEEVQQVDTLKKLLKEERITFWDSVPTTMNYLIGELEAAKDDFVQHDLRLVFLSGDWIPVHLPDRIRPYFPSAELISLGGATEATVWSNYYPINEVHQSWSSIPYGKPIKNNTFYILDDNLQPVPKGVAGELYIGGVGVARGYANDPEKTAAAFKPDPFGDRPGGIMYKTGDLGRLLPDGNMEFLGRKDNQVKIRGFRVELGEIESVLQKHENIKGAIVDIYNDAAGMNQLCAYLLADELPAINEIKEYLKGRLPAYMIPGHFMVLGSFPLNSNGKIDRKALPRPSASENDALLPAIPPATSTQVQVEKIWRSILNTGSISIRDDLFELGANSLSVGAFVNRVQREMNLTLNIRNVFVEPTIEAISNEIDKIKWASGDLYTTEDISDTENFLI
ncbi:hypothetical protein A4H97_31915 [Niastella yeongjuensis]|uniref:Carrier domain-containing protein n=1 Tax=Niastella yeongjuensis TaxID=354355 RepID=A0A1V9EIF7_9BACT|nr:non-ribosomal peptide synthetase [Niastella yeongjuensis]OQP45852.1 hypothetical protein A4H97_31915 [Niastella yeongjuensis]SEP46635.1 amino acid adenylation domain-containing protein [Niastella yeongjuensis]